jgi:GMP synthase (glutamine-hydrolysing)
MKRVLIVDTGRPPRRVVSRWGPFPTWFERLLLPRVGVEVADATAPLPSASGFDGVLLTGSPASVTAETPWMLSLAHWSLAAARDRPVLGVCFGHQLLGRALGARVEPNPRGPECGVRTVTLTGAGQADPLFDGLPASFLAPEFHEDHVSRLPPGAILLAHGAATPVEAFAAGEGLRSVQFHPEFDPGRGRSMTEAGRSWLDAKRPGTCSAALATIRPTPLAERVLGNWLTHFVGAGG